MADGSTSSIAAAQLRSFVERIEKLEAEKSELGAEDSQGAPSTKTAKAPDSLVVTLSRCVAAGAARRRRRRGREARQTVDMIVAQMSL